MLEMLLNPRRAEKRPVEIFIVGVIYSFLSIVITNFIFSGEILSKYSGIVVVTFTVMFSMPFMYYLLRHEEEKDVKYYGSFRVIKEHCGAISALLWLFLGFVFSFSLWYVITGNTSNFQAQLETYCYINHPSNIDLCVQEYSDYNATRITGHFSFPYKDRFFTILFNNLNVLVVVLIFSLIFGAGAIFILAWNASVIAVAIGIFTKMKLSLWPLAMLRYMVHGSLEIASYFIAAIAGGIISMAIVRQKFDSEKIKEVLKDFLNLVVLSIAILIFAAALEVFIIAKF